MMMTTTTTMNNFKTVSQFPSIESIPQNKIKSSNIAHVYGYLLLVFHVPPRPLKLIFTDLTTYRDNLVLIRDVLLDPELISKLDPDSLFSVSLNQVQASKLQGQLARWFKRELNFQMAEQLHRMGIIVKLEFYLKNFKNYLEGMCIDLELVRECNNGDTSPPPPPQLMQLMNRINANFNVTEFDQRSPVRSYFNPPAKRKTTTNILFQPAKKPMPATIQDSRFDTQQILFNLYLSSAEDDDDDDEGDSLGDDEAEDSFISVFTSLRDLKKIPKEQDIGKFFKLNGYLIEYQRGFNEIIFVEQTELTHLNESNSIILKTDKPDQFTMGKKLEIRVTKQVVSIGLIDITEFKLV